MVKGLTVKNHKLQNLVFFNSLIAIFKVVSFLLVEHDYREIEIQLIIRT